MVTRIVCLPHLNDVLPILMVIQVCCYYDRIKLNVFLYTVSNRAKLHRANVHFLSEPIKDGTTGTVIVLTTPDAHRTMLAYQVS